MRLGAKPSRWIGRGHAGGPNGRGRADGWVQGTGCSAGLGLVWDSSLSETKRTGSVQTMNSDRRTCPGGLIRRPHEPHVPRRSERLPDIDTGRCTGCGRCVAVCGPHLLSLEVVRWEKFAVLHERERCAGCSACAASCPFHAIAMRKPATVG